MKVAGFTFIRNAVLFDYPIVEAINSILPLCDYVVVAVGNSDDNTMELIQHIHPTKIKIITTVWDDNLREGGRVLAVETDKAYNAIEDDVDWCFYIQGDEIVHEKYHENILSAMTQWKNHKEVEGLLFDYLHFYGSYDYVGASTKWYQNEIRIVRKSKNIFSFRDAQGFRHRLPDRPLNVKKANAAIYHYGWVKDPRAMQKKQENFHKYWHSDDWIKNHIPSKELFDYTGIDSLQIFTENHPCVMEERIKRLNWKFDYDISMNKHSLKDKLKKFITKTTGINPGYKNYKLI